MAKFNKAVSEQHQKQPEAVNSAVEYRWIMTGSAWGFVRGEGEGVGVVDVMEHSLIILQSALYLLLVSCPRGSIDFNFLNIISFCCQKHSPGCDTIINSVNTVTAVWYGYRVLTFPIIVKWKPCFVRNVIFPLL